MTYKDPKLLKSWDLGLRLLMSRVEYLLPTWNLKASVTQWLDKVMLLLWARATSACLRCHQEVWRWCRFPEPWELSSCLAAGCWVAKESRRERKAPKWPAGWGSNVPGQTQYACASGPIVCPGPFPLLSLGSSCLKHCFFLPLCSLAFLSSQAATTSQSTWPPLALLILIIESFWATNTSLLIGLDYELDTNKSSHVPRHLGGSVG